MKDFLLKRKRVFVILAPAFLGALYLILCLANIRQSVWFDESFSSYLTRFNFGEIWNLTAADVHPPLYYFTLKIWAHFFGHTDFAMRTLSAIFGALAILFAFLWLKYKYGLRAAIVAGFLLSISPIFVRYGQEMRMYTMIVMIVFAATYVLQLAIDNRHKCWWVLYGILLTLGMWTHYFAIFAWFAHLVYIFVSFGKDFWKKKLWMPYVLAILLYLPWIPNLFLQTKIVEQNGLWIPPVSLTTIADYFSESLYYMTAAEVKNWLLVLAILTVAIILFLAIRYRKKMIMLRSIALVPVILLTLISLPPLGSMFVPRYIIYAMISVSIISGVGLVMFVTELREKGSKSKKVRPFLRPELVGGALMIILSASSIVGLASVYAKGNYNIYTNIKSASKDLYDAVIGLDGGQNLPIVSNSAWLYYDLAAYTSEEHPVLFINEQTEYKYGSMEPLRQSYFGRIDDLDKWLGEHDSFWYVGSAPEDSANSILEFPRDGWRATEIISKQFNEHSDEYQILKLERE